MLLVTGYGFANVYSVSGSTIKFIGDIYGQCYGTKSNVYVFEASFSMDDSVLILSNSNGGGCYGYTLGKNYVAYPITDTFVDKHVMVCLNDTDIAKNTTASVYKLFEHTHEQYLTAIPDEYVTDEKLAAKGYLTEHQSLEGLATEGYVNEKVATAVQHTTQELTEEQKTQARTNINAQVKITGTTGQVVGFDANGNAIAQDATDGGSTITIKTWTAADMI